MTLSHPLAATLAALVAWPAWAQEPEPRPEVPQELELPGLEGTDAAREEMVRLFHEVERTLEAIDIELADAGAGEIPLDEGKESGIDRLLRSSRNKGQEVVDGIDRILEIARELSPKNSGT